MPGEITAKNDQMNRRTFMTILWPGFRKHPGRFMFTSCRVRNHPLAWRTRRANDCAGDLQRHLRWYQQTDSRLTSTETQNWPNHLPGSQGRDSVRTARLSRRQQTSVLGGFVLYAD